MKISGLPRRRLVSSGRMRLATAVAVTAAALPFVAFQPRVSAAEPSDSVGFPIGWELVNPNSVDELSRQFDVDEDGRIDGPPDQSRVRIQKILNPEAFVLAVHACAAPDGATGFDWSLARPGEPAAVTLTSTQCRAELTLPDLPYPDAVTYDLTVVVNYPSSSTTRTERIKLQDLFIVGLGDSYGSGEGNPVNNDDGEWDNDRCHRSRASGQEQAVRSVELWQGVTVSFLHVACSGAEAKVGILEPYGGLISRPIKLPAQVTQVSEYIGYSTRPTGSPRWPDVVITSVGGNDAGFASVVKACLLPGGFPIVTPTGFFGWVDLPECYEPDSFGKQAFSAGLPKLPNLYREIDQARLGAHPALPALCNPDDPCDFLITEYPDGATDEVGGTCEHAGFGEDEFQWVIDTMVPQLNSTLAASSNELGWRYVTGIREAFKGHGICAEDDWFRDIFESIDVQGGATDPDINGAFHPDGDGHAFGYGSSIYDDLHELLGLPVSAAYNHTEPLLIRREPVECDTVTGDGYGETLRHSGPTDLAGLDIEPDLANRIRIGSFGQPVAGSHTCRDWGVVRPPSGVAPRHMATGRPNCPVQSLACRGSSAATAVASFPAWGDRVPLINFTAQAQAERSADQSVTPFYRRSSDANAHGGSAFIALGSAGSSTVSGEILVHLQTRVQANGANAHAGLDVSLDIENVINEQSCDEWGECTPATYRQIAAARLNLQRSVCQERLPLIHGCETGYGDPSSKLDSVDYDVRINGTDVSSIHDSGRVGGVNFNSAGVGLLSGSTVPDRTIRIPYSVPAGSVVTIIGSVGASATMNEVCANSANNLPCDGQANVAMRVTFVPDVASGALLPLAGRTTAQSDMIPPVVTCDPPGNWSATDKVINCTATDGTGVGLADPTTESFSMSTAMGAGNEGIVSLDPPAVCDKVGNCTDLPALSVRIDRKVPTITSANDAKTYPLGTLVAVDAQCTDGGSGIAVTGGCVASRTTLLTTTAGTKHFTIDATDAVGNTFRKTVTYIVSPNGPEVSIDNASVVEGHDGTRLLSIPVSVSLPTAQAVTVVVAIKPGTARPQSDYTGPARVTVTIGQGDLSKDLQINIRGDQSVEQDETIKLEIVSVSRNVVVGQRTAIGTILDDD